jgi:hypothetical protein
LLITAVEDRRFSARFNNKVEKRASARPLPSTPLMPVPSRRSKGN